jgi:hypothetical protein
MDCGGKAPARHRFGQLPTHRVYRRRRPRPKRRRHFVLPAHSITRQTQSAALFMDCGGKAPARHRFGQLPTHRSKMPGKSSSVSGRSSRVPGKPSRVPGRSSSVPGNSSNAPGKPSSVPGKWSFYPHASPRDLNVPGTWLPFSQLCLQKLSSWSVPRRFCFR